MSMKFRAVILVSILLALLSGSVVSGENLSANNSTPSQNLTNESVSILISPQEELMNLAFEAREFALEEGKDDAITEFSSPSGKFSTDGRYIVAYGMDGVLLADKTRSGDIGSRYIADDHDSGMVRQMRDLAASGGGLYTDPKTGNFWFIVDIDGSWWICATLESGTGL